MQFGHFDDAKKEYVITSPKTPLPWINYLGSENFFSLISNTCGGYRTDATTTSRTAIPSGTRAGSRPRRRSIPTSAIMALATAALFLPKT